MTKLAWFVVAGVCFLVSEVKAQEQSIIKSQMDMLNYGIGVETARSLKSQGVEVNLDLLIQGLKDGLSGKSLPISEKELRKTIVSFQSELRRRKAVSRQLATMDNLSSGEIRPQK